MYRSIRLLLFIYLVVRCNLTGYDRELSKLPLERANCSAWLNNFVGVAGLHAVILGCVLYLLV